MGELLTPKEVMALLKISQGKLYQLIRDGVIPSVFDQGWTMIPKEELDKMLRQQLKSWEGKISALGEGLIVLPGGRAERRTE